MIVLRKSTKKIFSCGAKFVIYALRLEKDCSIA